MLWTKEELKLLKSIYENNRQSDLYLDIAGFNITLMIGLSFCLLVALVGGVLLRWAGVAPAASSIIVQSAFLVALCASGWVAISNLIRSRERSKARHAANMSKLKEWE